MNNIHLTNIDLNLLTVFDAVMRERNATRAAHRIGLTQPAVSHALNRLRAVLGDPLFVRTPGGMVPTPFAQEMATPVRGMLEGIENLFSRERNFDPTASARAFTLGMSDYATSVLLPKVLEILTTEAPGVSITVKNTGHDVGLGMVDSGQAELAAGNFPLPPPHLRRELLYREGFVCAGRTGHPALNGRLTLKRYLAIDHLQVSTAGNPHGYVDDVLDKMNVRRRVKATVGHFLAAPLLLENTDLLATEPTRLFSALGKRHGLRLATPPFALPEFEVVQIWHARHDGDPGHAWLRTVLRRAATK